MAVIESQRLVHMQSGMDERFFAFQLRREEEKDSEGQNTSESFLLFESHLHQATHSAHKSKLAQLKFWEELAQPVPDLNLLFQLGGATYKHVFKAQLHFDKVLRLNDSAPNALRLFAAFLLEVLHDNERAQELLRRADEVEEEAAERLAEAQRNASELG
ncbi:MAG: hypothetical protein ACK4GD_13075, partial [Sphingomonadaceae bacterium]